MNRGRKKMEGDCGGSRDRSVVRGKNGKETREEKECEEKEKTTTDVKKE